MEMKVGKKIFTLEYTFEAAANKGCIDAAMDIFGGVITTRIDDRQSETLQIRDFIMSLSDLPRMAMEMFYAGLLENHGEEGDGSITSLSDAKKVYKQFCKENPEDVKATSYYGLCTAISAQMEADGFFKRTGMMDILGNMSKVKNPVKNPSDRKKKQPTKKQREAAEQKAAEPLPNES